MDQRLMVLALLTLASVHVIESTGYRGRTKTSTTEPPTRNTDDHPVTIFIPLDVSYNLTTRWLGVLRDNFVRTIEFERAITITNWNEAVRNIKEASQVYKREMDDLVMQGTDRDRPCVEKNKEQMLQVLSTLDQELEGCAKPLESMTSDYETALEEILQKVNAQDEADIYTPCLPNKPLTVRILREATDCFNKRYAESVYSFYHPTGQELFNAVSGKALSFKEAETQAKKCELTIVRTHDDMLTEKLEQLRMCTTTVAGGKYGHHNRSKRGFGKKFKKAWKKVRNGAKKLCKRIPCQVGYSVALPGK